MYDDKRKDEIIKHKKYIESNLKTYEHDNGILQKYKWLAKYHNKFCYNSRFYSASEYLVEV